MPVVKKFARSRGTSMVESTPVRVVRRREPVEGGNSAVQVMRRIRGTDSLRAGETGLPYFFVDWSKSLGYKLQIYLVTSFLYYHLNRSMITDTDFDRLCKELAAGWRSLQHPHKHCVDRGSLVAGTGYDIKYPTIVKGAAFSMLDHFSERRY